MNCAECQTDPLTPGHYCPCCGRKLSLEEQRALDATLPAAAPVRTRVIATKPSHDPAPVAVLEAAALDTTREVTMPSPVVNVEEVRMAKAKAVADLTAQAHLAKAANPAPVIRRPIPPVPSAPERRSHTPMLMMAAAVIVGAIGAAEGARRLGFEWPGQNVRETSPVQVTAVAEAITPPERRAVSPDIPSPVKAVQENKVVTAARPKPRTAAEKPAPVRPANPSVQQGVPVVARPPSPEIPRPAPMKSSVAESARPPAPLTGRFFESNDVDEPPRIASRVAPRLPANLPAGADQKIVVARVLVSRTGQPHRVSLLRGSMLGRASDEAVVAALTQWTFSPATKRGEPVNCWYNIGIPLGQAD